MSLKEKPCVPCRGSVEPLRVSDARILLEEIPSWELNVDATRLEKSFSFTNFMEAMEFCVKVGTLAEAEGHHPDISFGWGYCRVIFFTHKIGGLHENDFIMAAKVDSL